jgi:hypothetical protein
LQTIEPAPWVNAFLALAVTCGFFGLFYLLMFRGVPTKATKLWTSW